VFVAADVKEYNSWDERVRPRRNLPDPEEASLFISTALTGKPRYRVVSGVPVVLQEVLQIFGGTERWDRWDHHDGVSCGQHAGPTGTLRRYHILAANLV
jgi:hypothetical protein